MRNQLGLLALGFFVAACGNQGGAWSEGTMSPAMRASDDVVAIIRAIDAGDIAKLRSLLDAGAAPTPKGSPLSAIHAAITHFKDGKLVCDYEALKLLLDHQADPNFVDEDSGFTALEDALAIGDIPCAALLREAGASLDRRGHSGQSILQFAVKGAVRTGDTRILKLVLSWGVDPNVLSGVRSSTALHEAAGSNPGQAAAVEAVITELLSSGTNPCIADSHGNTALDIASNLNRSASIQKLLTDAMHGCTGA